MTATLVPRRAFGLNRCAWVARCDRCLTKVGTDYSSRAAALAAVEAHVCGGQG